MRLVTSGRAYRYGPSILVNADGSIDMWTCSPGENGVWDVVRYRHSSAGGRSFTPGSVVLQPTPGTRDAFSTCDPGALRIGAYWYLSYTSTEDSRGTANHVYVARARNPSGPYEKWHGSGWGGAPQPIIAYVGNSEFSGIGEPSLVLHGRLYVYYTNLDGSQHTEVATIEEPVGEDWPAHLFRHGTAIVRHALGEDSTDIKYVDALGVL